MNKLLPVSLLSMFSIPFILAQSVKPIPVPYELSNEARYHVTVDGTPVPILHAGLNVYIASFDFTGSAKVKVNVEESDLNLEGFYKWRAITDPPVRNPDYFMGNAIVRPLARHIETTTNKNQTEFTLTEAGQYTLEAPGTGRFNDETLLIFANAPETNVPKKDAPGVLYLEPGIHQEHITLKSHQTLYLAPGAVLWGAVNVWDADQVSIRGRGVVLYQDPLKFGVDNGPFNKPNQHSLTTHNVNGLTVEGVTFVIRAQTWSVQLVSTNDVLFNNVKIVNVTPSNINGDGIDWMDGIHGRFMHSFIRSSDDSFAFLAASALANFRPVDPAGVEHLGTVKDVLISDCVFWNTFGGILRLGWTSQSLTTSNITLRDSDVIHGNSLLVIGIPKRVGHARHSDYSFQDLRFEQPATYAQWSNDTSAQFSNFLFKNITMPRRPGVASGIVIDMPGVHFDNVHE